MKCLKVRLSPSHTLYMMKGEQMPLPNMKPRNRNVAKISMHTLDSFSMCARPSHPDAEDQAFETWQRNEKAQSCCRLLFMAGLEYGRQWTAVQDPKRSPQQTTTPGHSPAGSSQLQPPHKFSELNSIYTWMHQKLFQLFSTKKTNC